MPNRLRIRDFELANRLYAGAEVTFWGVTAGVKNTTRITLYAAVTGVAVLSNPQRLDSKGRLKQPVYVETATIATVDGVTFSAHDTGIIFAEFDSADALAENLPLQRFAAGTGTGDAVVVTIPAITALADGLEVRARMPGANTITNPTLNVSALGAKTIVVEGNLALVAGEYVANKECAFRYRLSTDRWELITPGYTVFSRAFLQAATAAAAQTAIGLGATAKGDLLTAVGAGAFARKAVGADGKMLAPSSGAADGLAWVDQGIALQNGRFNARVTSNTLIFEVLTNAGNAPSDSDPVFVALRSDTATSGAYVVAKLTAALTLTVPDTATLGTVNATAARLYCFFVVHSGVPRLGVYNPYDPAGPNLVGLDDNSLITASAILPSSDSAVTPYCSAAIVSLAFRTIGYCEITEATAGTWATAPAKVHTLKPGDYKTGDVVQTVRQVVTSAATGTTLIPADDTIPQNTEGDQYMTKSIVPTNAINLLDVEVHAPAANSNAGSSTRGMALFRDSAASAISAVAANGGANEVVEHNLFHQVQAGSVSSTSFNVRIGANAAGTTTFLGSAGARLYGTVMRSILKIQEIFT